MLLNCCCGGPAVSPIVVVMNSYRDYCDLLTTYEHNPKWAIPFVRVDFADGADCDSMGALITIYDSEDDDYIYYKRMDQGDDKYAEVWLEKATLSVVSNYRYYTVGYIYAESSGASVSLTLAGDHYDWSLSGCHSYPSFVGVGANYHNDYIYDIGFPLSVWSTALPMRAFIMTAAEVAAYSGSATLSGLVDSSWESFGHTPCDHHSCLNATYPSTGAYAYPILSPAVADGYHLDVAVSFKDNFSCSGWTYAGSFSFFGSSYVVSSVLQRGATPPVSEPECCGGDDISFPVYAQDIDRIPTDPIAFSFDACDGIECEAVAGASLEIS